MNMPKDPVILLSFINTQLRDCYPSLEELCKSCDIPMEELIASLAAIDYHYQPDKNQFLEQSGQAHINSPAPQS